MLERKQVYDLPYSISSDGDIKSHERAVTRGSRWGTVHTFIMPPKEIKRDIKRGNDTRRPIARVQLYPLEGGRKKRRCYYVARLVWSMFMGVDYFNFKRIGYLDGNPNNCKLENLYETDKPVGTLSIHKQ